MCLNRWNSLLSCGLYGISCVRRLNITIIRNCLRKRCSNRKCTSEQSFTLDFNFVHGIICAAPKSGPHIWMSSIYSRQYTGFHLTYVEHTIFFFIQTFKQNIRADWSAVVNTYGSITLNVIDFIFTNRFRLGYTLRSIAHWIARLPITHHVSTIVHFVCCRLSRSCHRCNRNISQLKKQPKPSINNDGFNN